MATKLILAPTEANNYIRYLTGFSAGMTGSNTVFIGLGTLNGTAFTEIIPNAANNYARAMIKSGSIYPDVLTINGRKVHNHEQIVFNKVLSEAYSAPAIAFYRQETGGTPYAFGVLDETLEAVVGSLPMFERNALQITIPDGSEED